MTDAHVASPATRDGAPVSAAAPQHRMLESDRCTEWLGAEVLTADEGHAKIQMTVRPEMTNGFDIVHGGMIFTLADTCFAMACNHPDGDEGTVTVAAGADITFLKAARVGDVLTAEAHPVAQAGRSGVYDVVITRESETVAVFRGRSRTIPFPQEGGSR
jgi:acyl-CoA thioesterase